MLHFSILPSVWSHNPMASIRRSSRSTGNIPLCLVNLQSVPVKHTAREGHMMGPCQSQSRPDVNVMFRCMLSCMQSLLSRDRNIMHAHSWLLGVTSVALILVTLVTALCVKILKLQAACGKISVEACLQAHIT